MRLLFALCLSCLVAASVVTATVIVPAEFSEVVSGSELIAYGRVLEVRPEWADGRSRIDSIVTLDVLSWVKGGTDETVAFTVPGGEIGRYRHVMVGAPVFKPGDEAFVFLKAQGASRPYVFGLNQGVFRVRVDARGQRLVTTPALLATGDAPALLRRGAVTRQPVAMEAFRTQIRSAMAVRRSAAQ